MTIPFLDLGRLHGAIRSELDEAIDRVVRQSSFVGGAEIEQFEHSFAAAHGRAHAVGCASGTDALSLALRAAGVAAGDEVVVPSMTFFATAEAVFHAGATPLIADVDPETLLITEESVDAVRTERTRAVIPVHLYGHVVDFACLRSWKADGLVVVEDAAQAHLASWRGEAIGSAGDAACFSFFPGKNLGAFGDAGALITDDPQVAASARKLRDHGRTKKYVHDQIGVSSRLDGLQAAILRVKLRHLEAWTERRRQIALAYSELLAGCSQDVRLVPWAPGAVHHLLVVRVDAAARSALRSHLERESIGAGVHYPVPLSRQPALQGRGGRCERAELAAEQVLSLPIDPMMTDDEVERVVETVGTFMARS